VELAEQQRLQQVEQQQQLLRQLHSLHSVFFYPLRGLSAARVQTQEPRARPLLPHQQPLPHAVEAVAEGLLVGLWRMLAGLAHLSLVFPMVAAELLQVL
jgi:hypothetical protein